MRKTRLYLDTSIISMIDAPYAPDKEAITKEFFRIVSEQTDEYEIFISPMGISEIKKSPKEKLASFMDFLQNLHYTMIPQNQEADTLSGIYVAEGVLSVRHIDDLTHIAYAVITRCDYVISWNMKHLVRIQTINRVNAVNLSYKYPSISITTPLIVTGEVPNEND